MARNSKKQKKIDLKFQKHRYVSHVFRPQNNFRRSRRGTRWCPGCCSELWRAKRAGARLFFPPVAGSLIVDLGDRGDGLESKSDRSCQVKSRVSDLMGTTRLQSYCFVAK